MGKNHRYKKQLRAERGKTKLKTVKTKFLPKGQNVTDATFKFKPIVIRPQLSQCRDPVTARNLNIRDILSRIRHHNIIVKVNSLHELTEYIGSVRVNDLSSHTVDILESVCPLYTNAAAAVRKEAVKVTVDLLNVVGVNGVEPHFDRIVAYLCCAMSHISEDVREDSLLVFDVVAERTPGLLAKRCGKVARNFVPLISRVKENAGDRSVLEMNVKAKRTGSQWRLMVLLRFKTFLKVILDGKEDDRKASDRRVDTVRAASDVVRTSIVRDHYSDAVDIFGPDITIDDWLERSVGDVLPLLRDVWLEVQPRTRYAMKSADMYCTALTDETVNVLNCVLSIVRYFYELMVVKRKEDGEDRIDCGVFINGSKAIIKLLFGCFPYSRVNWRRTPFDFKCLEENLTLCYLFFVFFEGVYQKDSIIQALSYLNACLLNRNYVKPEKSSVLLKVLTQFYTKNIVRWEKYRTTDLMQFVKNTAKYYVAQTTQVNSIEIFILLCGQVDLISEYFLIIVKKACRSLLGNRIEGKAFQAIRSLVLQEIKEVQRVLSGLLPNVLDNIELIELEGVGDKNLKIGNILRLYYHIPLTNRNVHSLWQFGFRNEHFLQITQDIIAASRNGRIV